MTTINFIHIPKNGGTSIEKICKRNSNKNDTMLVYNPHLTDVYNTNITNQFIVIRNPIDRFISSVYYAIQKWSHEPQIKYLISKGITTPEKWIQIWSNENNPEHNNLMLEMLNKKHRIGNNKIKYKWTYTPQSAWINNPKFVIIMDNFNDEFQYFKKKYKINGEIKNKNTTKHIDDKLSKESIEFLLNFYKDDFVLYEKYKRMNIEERI